MAEIIDITMNKKKEYEAISKRIEELEEILGYNRLPDGSSLSRRSRNNTFARRRFAQIQDLHFAEAEEFMHLTAQAIQLEDELGISDEMMKMLDNLPDSDIDIFS